MQNLIHCRFVKPVKGHFFGQNFFRYTSVSLLLLFILTNLTVGFAQTLTLSHPKPKQGDTLLFTYDTRGGKFEKDTLKVGTIITNDGFNQESKKVALIKNGTTYSGRFLIDSATLVIAFAFSSNKIWDTAPSQGHLYPIYANDKIVEGALLVMADFYIGKVAKTIYDLEPNYHKAAVLFKQEIELYPNGKYKVSALQKYYQVSYKLNPEKGRAEVLTYINSIDLQEEITDADLYKKFRLYEILQMKTEMEKTLELITIRFPNSPIIFSRRYKEVLTPKAAEEMEVSGNKLIVDYNMVNGKEFSTLANSVYQAINQAYIKELNLPKFYDYLAKLSTADYRLVDLISAATFLAQNKKELKEAEKIVVSTAQLVDTLIKNTTSTITLKRLKERKIELNGLLGRIFYDQEKYDEAYFVLKNAHEGNSQNLEFITIYYALSLVKRKDYQKAKPLLEECLRKGNVDSEVTAAFKRVFLNIFGDTANYTVALKALKAEAHLGKQLELQKVIENTPAPNFTLVDSEGKKVSLIDYKGKIIVLDFWATWCIPCLKAFPGMKKLIKKYENDQDIVFLFINTAETFTKDLSKTINAYLKKSNYSFHVLIDKKDMIDGAQKFKTQSLYHADTLPLKVVIDKAGNIRFRSVGYVGSDEKVVEELSAFIEALR